MHLANFSLTDVSAHGRMIAFKAYGFEWDLHNFADFQGFDYSTTITSSTLTLKWNIAERIIKWRDAGGRYGVPNYPCDRFHLVFSHVDYLEITPRDTAMPRGEDLGISSVFCCEADEVRHSEIGSGLYFALCEETGPYHLVFQFNGGQIIRVGAETAEFVMREKAEEDSRL